MKCYSIMLRVSITCVPNYYDSQCNVYCLASADSRANCSSNNGTLLCKKGLSSFITDLIFIDSFYFRFYSSIILRELAILLLFWGMIVLTNEDFYNKFQTLG